MKIAWQSSPIGYCRREERLLEAEALLTAKMSIAEKQGDKLGAEDLVNDLGGDRASTQRLLEHSQAVRSFMDKIPFQAIDLNLRKKMTELRYFAEGLTPFQQSREKRLLNLEAGLERKTIKLNNMSNDYEIDTMLDEASGNFGEDFDTLENEQEKIKGYGEKLDEQYRRLEERKTKSLMRYLA